MADPVPAVLAPAVAVAPPAPYTPDFDSPYYLSTSDHGGVVIVTKPLTGVGDFPSWLRAFRMALEGRNKIGFVDGSLPMPAEDDPTHRFWVRNNAIVGGWIMNSVAEHIAQSLLYVDTARDMWLFLSKSYQQSSAPRKYRVKQKLRDLRQASMDVASYFTAIFAVWKEFKSIRANHSCTCGRCTCLLSKRWNDEDESDFVIDFLFGLNDEYEGVRSHILAMDPPPDLQTAYNLVLQQEQQRLIRPVKPSDAVVFQTSSPSLPEAISAVSSSTFKGKQRPLCTHCGLYGHTIQKCYRLHGFPPGYRAPKSGITASPRPSARSQTKPSNNFANVATDTGCVADVDKLSLNQIHDLCSKINNRLKSSNATITENGAPASDPDTGTFSGIDDWEG
ncbi:PREDICTED: uncharacterized protein LOC104800268 [Tarenaya hassleriana]|uniref:uncharacterized protein LOC104800268 n=1 Tax=Tarenaya hassleriana TaxID=28532 RepID=UPI00053C50F4|nr:PREDICTED: uncharacterized protein LOC104800268 [Tarenaya hassleriana]